MTLVTVSAKRNRVYARKFDHDEARRLVQAGASYQEVASMFGVTYAAVRRVVDPRVRRKMDEATRRQFEYVCEDCGGLCTHNFSSKRGNHDRVVCKACAVERRREDELLKRLDDEGNLRCGRCHEHKPVEAFRMRATGFPNHTCKACVNGKRREWRLANLERARQAERRRYKERKAAAVGHSQRGCYCDACERNRAYGRAYYARQKALRAEA